MEILFFLILPVFIFFTLWLGSRILNKAGLDKKWVFCLLIPIINILMIWVFAFSVWPNLKDDVEQGLN